MNISEYNVDNVYTTFINSQMDQLINHITKEFKNNFRKTYKFVVNDYEDTVINNILKKFIDEGWKGIYIDCALTFPLHYVEKVLYLWNPNITRKETINISMKMQDTNMSIGKFAKLIDDMGGKIVNVVNSYKFLPFNNKITYIVEL